MPPVPAGRRLPVLPAPGPAAQVEIQLGHACNNRCVFCVSGQLTAQGLARPLPAGLALAALAQAAARGARKVTFLGGEPTLQASLLPAIARAIDLGFTAIVLFTNGVKTARAGYIDEILALGAARSFTGFEWRFSIQGGDEASHDHVTEKPGSFQRLVAGLRHLRDRGQHLTANACINTRSYRSLPGYVDLVREHDIRQLHLDQVRPRDAGQRSDAELRAMMPRYSDQAPFFRAMLDRFDREQGPDFDINVGNLPFCVMPERAAQIHHDGESTLTVAADGEHLSQPWDKYADKRSDKFHPPACAACRFRPRCNGIFSKYAEFHGTAEFIPVPGLSLGPAAPRASADLSSGSSGLSLGPAAPHLSSGPARSADPPAMKYRTLPNSDLQLSALGLGCWTLGGEGWGPDPGEAAAADTVAAAIELGINWFDTAPLYADGRADQRLARALGARRHDLVIATKVGARKDASGHAHSDLSPANLVADVEASLRRLGLDVLPLLQIHWPCERGTPLAASLDALAELRAAGKLRHVGLCNYNPAGLRAALAHDIGLVSLQTPYSMVRREFEHGLRDMVLGTGPEGQPVQRLGVLAYETLCRGLLAGAHTRSPPSFPGTDLRAHDPRFREPSWTRLHRLSQALSTVATRLQVEPAALAVAWVLRQPGISVAVVGARSPAQIRGAAQALGLLSQTRVWRALQPHIDVCRP
ncbi:aldo/keto reductase [Nannocystis sp.]|uniref:aldo/keto reductase n=1 Tax=Nannocystis sp. TaxID=1962667 RepID=UPI0025EF6B74|nr:aldo/keto reductase [Nannocystis sp.]MBK7824264.1 aldo/keto reductase [Nannocystis sp.]